MSFFRLYSFSNGQHFVTKELQDRPLAKQLFSFIPTETLTDKQCILFISTFYAQHSAILKHLDKHHLQLSSEVRGESFVIGDCKGIYSVTVV